MPARTRNVYVRPASAGLGSDVARFGTSWAPPLAAARSNAVSPSWVRRSTDRLTGSYADAGSTDWIASAPNSTLSVPPRCGLAAGSADTNRAPAPTPRPATGGPMGSGRATAPVCGSMRHTLPSPSCPTQTPPSPPASALGPWPTGTVPRTTAATGSTRDTVSSSAFATQTAPASTVTAAGPRPTLTASTILPVAGSSLSTSPSARLVTQIAPAPAAAATVVRTRPAAGSIRERVWSSRLTTHTEPSPTATPVGPLPTFVVWTTLLCRG